MDTTHLCIARHGETDWNKRAILQGWSDIPINDHGRQQARTMAQGFASMGFSAIWSSPLARAHETAAIIAAALGLAAPQCHDGLKERHFGAIQGIPKSELADQNPVLLAQILRRNPQALFVGGESMDEFADRVLNAFAHIGGHHGGQQVLVVTHGWVLDVVLRHIGGFRRSAVLQEKPKNAEFVWATVQNGVLAAP